MSLVAELTEVRPEEMKKARAEFEAKRKARLNSLSRKDVVAKSHKNSVQTLLKGRIQYSQEMLQHDSMLTKMIADKVRGLQPEEIKNVKVSKIVAQLASTKRKQKENNISIN